jgi:hypothetical protein
MALSLQRTARLCRSKLGKFSEVIIVRAFFPNIAGGSPDDEIRTPLLVAAENVNLLISHIY